jgi:hypothetical protein
MKLSNGDRADIPLEKLLNYCLNLNHPSGKHKARVFASALGITPENVYDLQRLIARAAVCGEVVQQNSTEFGQLFKVDWAIPGLRSSCTAYPLGNYIGQSKSSFSFCIHQIKKMTKFKLYDTIATLCPIAGDRLTLVEPEYQTIQQLPIGQVGTIVEIYDAAEPRYLVEFSDLQGREYAMAVLHTDEVLALHYELDTTAA